jgi:hypothetical protein
VVAANLGPHEVTEAGLDVLVEDVAVSVAGGRPDARPAGQPLVAPFADGEPPVGQAGCGAGLDAVLLLQQGVLGVELAGETLAPDQMAARKITEADVRAALNRRYRQPRVGSNGKIVILGYASRGRILKVVLTPDQEEIITLAWPDE